MPGWLIEWFGSRELTRAFWLITLLPSPIWLLMILWPSGKITRRLASPYVFPAFFGAATIALVVYAVDFGMPGPTANEGFSAQKDWFSHPLVFLIFWAQLLTANLFLGCSMYQQARERKRRIPLELALAWILGPMVLPLIAPRMAGR